LAAVGFLKDDALDRFCTYCLGLYLNYQSKSERLQVSFFVQMNPNSLQVDTSSKIKGRVRFFMRKPSNPHPHKKPSAERSTAASARESSPRIQPPRTAPCAETSLPTQKPHALRKPASPSLPTKQPQGSRGARRAHARADDDLLAIVEAGNRGLWGHERKSRTRGRPLEFTELLTVLFARGFPALPVHSHFPFLSIRSFVD
jgi:hypothetical protein